MTKSNAVSLPGANSGLTTIDYYENSLALPLGRYNTSTVMLETTAPGVFSVDFPQTIGGRFMLVGVALAIDAAGGGLGGGFVTAQCDVEANATLGTSAGFVPLVPTMHVVAASPYIYIPNLIEGASYVSAAKGATNRIQVSSTLVVGDTSRWTFTAAALAVDRPC